MRLALALLLVLALPVAAQDTGGQPTLEVTFDETETIPGQPLSLRLTVLVPTYMPQPPVWPSLEAPNLLVRLPEGSTGPTSDSVGGETWAGVTRNYRVSPMVRGDFSLPPQDVVVTYADPETNEAVKVTLQTDAIAFSGVIPAGAEGLDPFIAATALELTQDIDGDPAAMVPGDSVSRTVTARIEGTSPMFLPELMPPTQIDGAATYPDEPTIAESDDRGIVSGTRTESVTLVAEGGGSGEVPAISLDWYNLDTGEVETAAIEGVAVEIDGPSAVTAEPRDWRAIAVIAGSVLLALALLGWATRRLVPPSQRWLAHRREERLASEDHAWRELRHVVRDRDYAHLYAALDRWATRLPGTDPRQDAEVRQALTALGKQRYGPQPIAGAGDWSALNRALGKARRTSDQPGGTRSALPPLNPGV